MGKLLGIVMSLIGAFCVATVVSAVVLAYYYAQAWHISNQRLVQAIGIMQGKSPEEFVEKPKPSKSGPEGESEQPSSAQGNEAIALKMRDLELREQSLRGEVERMQRDRMSFSDEKRKVEKYSKDFHKELDDIDKGEKEKGRDEVKKTLESLKPKQAKEQLVLMLARREMDDVVLILSAMPENKRAKIIAEFKTQEEKEQISDVLRRVRLGLPKTEITDAAQKKLQSPSGTGQ